MMKLTAAFLLCATTAHAQAVCGIDPHDYAPAASSAMSAPVAAALAAARATLTRRDALGTPSATGTLYILGTGMSTMQRFDEGVRRVLSSAAWKGTLPGVRYVKASKPGMTVEDWNDTSDPMWATAKQKLAAAGGTPLQVGIVLSMLTQEQPGINGPPMDTADLLGNAAAVAFHFPNAVHINLPHPFTGYLAPRYATKVPDSYIAADALLMRSFAESNPGLAYFFNTRSQGTITDAETGIEWQCSDVDPLDGHHPIKGALPTATLPNGSGAVKLAVWFLRWLTATMPEVTR